MTFLNNISKIQDSKTINNIRIEFEKKELQNRKLLLAKYKMKNPNDKRPDKFLINNPCIR